MVRITWTDSGLWHEKGWEPKKDIIENEATHLVDVITVGMLVHEEEDRYFIALSSDETNQHYYGVQVIGKFAVKRFDRLELEQIPNIVKYMPSKLEPADEY